MLTKSTVTVSALEVTIYLKTTLCAASYPSVSCSLSYLHSKSGGGRLIRHCHSMTRKAKARGGEKQSKTISMTGLTTTGKSSPVTGLEWPRGFQGVKVPRLHDNGTGWW